MNHEETLFRIVAGFVAVGLFCLAIFILGVISASFSEFLGLSQINIIWIAPIVVVIFYLIGYVIDKKLS